MTWAAFLGIAARLALIGAMLPAIAFAAAGQQDLVTEVPGAQGICDAVRKLQAAGRTQVVTQHAISVQQVALSSDLARLDDVRRFISDRGWRETTSADDYGMDKYPGQRFEAERLQLVPGKPDAWVFSTAVGSLHDPLLWIFESTPDGAMADHLLLQLGSEGSGPFETSFVHFREVPYAITVSAGEMGSSLTVYEIPSVAESCTVPPG